MQLIPVYDVFGKPTGTAMHNLYELLKERTPLSSISHKTMPTWERHVDFVSRIPYHEWYQIVVADDFVGATYLSKLFEVAVQLYEKFQRQGYGGRALAMLMDPYPSGTVFYANINPKNAPSISMCEKLGFKLLREEELQNVYKLVKP